MTSDSSIPEELEHLANEISPADLKRLLEMGLLEPPTRSPARETRETKSPAPAHDQANSAPAVPSGAAASTQREQPVQRTTSRPAPAKRFMHPVSHAAKAPQEESSSPVDFEGLQQLRFTLHEDKQAEEAKSRFRLRDIPTYLTIGGLSLALIIERTAQFLRRAKADFDRLPRVVQGAFYIVTGVLILVAAGSLLGTQWQSLLGGDDGPVLVEALAAPYQLETRAAPPQDAEPWQLIPDPLGEYERSPDVITAENPSSPTNQCLLGLGYDAKIINAPFCTRSYGVIGTASARYLDGRIKVDLAIARFSNDIKAELTMFELLRHARQYGQVGDFALGGVRDADYFFSSVRGWVTLTWRRGPWIFSLSSVKFESLEPAIEAYSY